MRHLKWFAIGCAVGAACCRAEAQCLWQKLSGDDEFHRAFGGGLALDDPILAVSCAGLNAKGFVYVLRRERNDWVIEGKLRCEECAQQSGFPGSVAIDGTTAAAGAYRDDGREARTGTVYIYERHGQDWIRTAKLFADDGSNGDNFGWRVALRGNRLLVGAPRNAGEGGLSGAAYLFERDADDVWRQKVLFRGDRPDVRFGHSLALGDGLVAVGDPDDFEKGNWSGAAWVFEELSDGIWSKTKLFGSDQGYPWDFGLGVALRNETLFVGSPGRRPMEGVYVFERRGLNDWREVAILEPADPVYQGNFGSSLSVHERTLLVGAPHRYRDGIMTGAAEVFFEDAPGVWNRVATLFASDGAWQDEFGRAVAVQGNLAVAGARYHDDPNADAGAAYVFAVGPDDDGDGVMDACECPGDLDGDRDVDLADLATLLSCLGRGENCADVDEDGRTDGADLAALLAHWGALCPR